MAKATVTMTLKVKFEPLEQNTVIEGDVLKNSIEHFIKYCSKPRKNDRKGDYEVIDVKVNGITIS